MVHNKYMQGGFGNNRENRAALTAFVAIAMMEAGVDKQVTFYLIILQYMKVILLVLHSNTCI